MMEYKIEIMMTPHTHDSINAPYFWSAMCTSGDFGVLVGLDGQHRLMRLGNKHMNIIQRRTNYVLRRL